MASFKSIPAYKSAVALSAVYFLSMMDRQIIAVLFDPIKADLGLSDFQLAMVSGLAFALFYSVAGVPFGRLADRTNRVNMLSICIALWSAATVATGLVFNFAQLLIARMAVGVGEAGCSPAAHSMISDIYKPEDRSTAIAIYLAGGSLGSALAYLFGGWMVDHYGWRAAMICVGIPGIFVAIALRLFMKEPKRAGTANEKQEEPSVGSVLTTLLSNTVYLMATFAHLTALGYLFVAATWLPSYVNRNFDLSFAEIGLFLAVSTLLGSCMGSLFSGVIADRMFKRNVRWLAGLPAIYLLLVGPIAAIGFSSSNLSLLFVCVVAIKALTVGSFVPSFSIVHYVIPSSMRGLAVATKIMIVTVIGVGIFPLIVGAISDQLSETYGNASLRYGLVGFAALCPLGSITYLLLLKLLPGQSIDEIENETVEAVPAG